MSGKTKSSSSLFWVVTSHVESCDFSLQPPRHQGPVPIAEPPGMKGLGEPMGAARGVEEEMASGHWR